MSRERFKEENIKEILKELTKENDWSADVNFKKINLQVVMFLWTEQYQ